MRVCLERLFIEGEHERIEQEKREKQQAEQIAAGKSVVGTQLPSYCPPPFLPSTDLSLMAGDRGMTFDPDFSFGNVMNNDPMFSLDSGIT